LPAGKTAKYRTETPAGNLWSVLPDFELQDGMPVPPGYFDFSYEHDKLHPGVGTGLRIGWNENFIIALDYGFALNRKDGLRGLYIGFGNLF